MSKQIVIDIVEKLTKYNTIVVTSHINPDGDAISSSYGLGLALSQQIIEAHHGKITLSKQKKGFNIKIPLKFNNF